MATKAELEAQIAKRDEPRPTVHAAIAGPVIVTGCLLLVAVLYLYQQRTDGKHPIDPSWLAIPAVVAWLVGHFAAPIYLPPVVHGNGPAQAARALAATACVSGAWWLVWTGRVGPGATWPLLMVWGGCLTLLWSAVLWLADHRSLVATSPVVVGDVVDRGMPWARLLEQSTQGRVVLTGEPTYHRAGARLTVEPSRFADDDGTEYDEDVTFDDFAGCADRFASLAAKEFRRRHPGQKLPVNSTRPEQGSDDAEFVLHVTMLDVFSESAAFVPSPGPQNIENPLDMGEYEDATRVLLTVLYLHSKIVGATGSGKSVEANNWIARITECSNALVWVCATDKLIPLVFGWLKPFFAGRTSQPVLDWVAGQHIDRVLDMLAAAYKLCCERNARLTDETKMTPTAAEPAVFVFVEEMSHTMEFHDTIVTHDGIEAGASKLIMMIARAGRSAGVQVVLMSQTALNSAAGDEAAEIVRNLTIRVCLRTNEGHDGWRTITALDGVDTTKLTNNMKIVQPSAEIPRAMPAKGALLDGSATIEQVAVRNASWRPVGGVEPESDLGREYRDRWSPANHPELVRALARHGLRWRIPDALVGTAAPVVVDTNTEETDMNRWTRKDDAEVAAYAQAQPVSQGHRGPGLYIPGGDEALAKLEALAQDLVDNPPTWEGPPTEAEVGEAPNPLPTTLAAIIEWFDREEEAGRLAEFYLTETLAAGIGLEDSARLGREIYRETRIRSRQATAAEGGGGRKGYDTRELDEAAKRIQFGL
jgi:hypothetical protein